MSGATVPVWDRVVRVLHWALAASVVTAFVTGLVVHQAHEPAGYAAGAIVLARVAWGWLGHGHARFSDFVRAPSAVLAYTAALCRRREPRHLGHNPLGGWMVLALLGCAAGASLTGALYVTDWLWGYAWLEALHAAFSWTFVALVPLHLAGVAWTSWRHRENLVAAMVTGRKPRHPD